MKNWFNCNWTNGTIISGTIAVKNDLTMKLVCTMNASFLTNVLSVRGADTNLWVRNNNVFSQGTLNFTNGYGQIHHLRKVKLTGDWRVNEQQNGKGIWVYGHSDDTRSDGTAGWICTNMSHNRNNNCAPGEVVFKSRVPASGEGWMYAGNLDR